MNTRDAASQAALGMMPERGLADVVRSAAVNGPLFSNPLTEAADNLLAKARRALTSGDDEGAERYLARALQLPFDDIEEVTPALWSGHMTLFNAVVDALEDAGEDDSRWLEAAIGVFENGSDGVRDHLGTVLRTILKAYQLPERESRLLKATLDRFPPADRRASYEREELDDAARASLVREAMRAEIEFSLAFAGSEPAE